MSNIYTVQCNLDLVTLNLVTTCDLSTIFKRPFFNLIHKNNIFSDIMQFSDSSWGDHCMYFLHKLEELPDFICKGVFFHERGKMYMSISDTVNNDKRDAP